MSFPRLIIAGTQSGVGKTTLTMGILSALSNRMRVQPYKIGPDYIDPAYHTFITNRKCRNLDGWMLNEDVIRYLFNKNMKDAEIGIIEGVMGLFDGAEIDKDIGSTAAVSKILNAPIILVIDGSGMARSAAAMVKGYAEFDKDLNIAGVIINRISGEKHYDLLKEAIEQNTNVKCYGYLPKNMGINIPSRHLGLVPSVEIKELKDKIDLLGKEIEKTIDIDGLIQLANKCNTKMKSKMLEIEPMVPKGKIKIAVAYDKAFNFYYQDNLELLEELGAELHFFSPINDTKLPENIDAIIFGGGFPEVFAEELEANGSMKKEIYSCLSKGIPYMAECGGLMYLNNTLVDFEGKEHKMVGWFNGKSMMTKRLQRFGYANLTLQDNCILGEKNESIKVHEFHRSTTEITNADKVYYLQKHRNNKVIKEWECGYKKENGVAAYAHMHFYSNLKFARNLIQNLIEIKKQ